MEGENHYEVCYSRRRSCRNQGGRKAETLRRSAEVKVYTKGTDISYAGCGLPYYIGGDIATRQELIVNSPEKYAGLTGAGVRTGCEAIGLDSAGKKVSIRSAQGEVFEESYDKLIIATGAVPFVPPVEGKDLPGVFCVRTPDDAVSIRTYAQEKKCRRAVVCGAGFIGLEVAENLLALKMDVTVIDAAPQIMPNAFDEEMAGYAKRQMKAAGMRILTSVSLKGDRRRGARRKRGYGQRNASCGSGDSGHWRASGYWFSCAVRTWKW